MTEHLPEYIAVLIQVSDNCVLSMYKYIILKYINSIYYLLDKKSLSSIHNNMYYF